MTLKFQFFHAIKKGYSVVFTEMGDSRSSNYFLIPNPIPLACIMTIYLLFVLVIGPKIMENRRPFKMRSWFTVFNVVLFILNFRMLIKGLRYWLFEYYSMCGPIDRSRSSVSMELINYVAWHFILKLLELLHTIILILSKRNRSTYPHIIRHSSMIGLGWLCLKYYPGSHCVFLAFIDGAISCIIHFIFILISNSEFFDRYWTWKNRVIAIKLVHYQIIIIHMLEQYVYGCNYSKFHLIFLIPLIFFVTNAFMNSGHEEKIEALYRLYKQEYDKLKEKN